MAGPVRRPTPESVAAEALLRAEEALALQADTNARVKALETQITALADGLKPLEAFVAAMTDSRPGLNEAPLIQRFMAATVHFEASQQIGGRIRRFGTLATAIMAVVALATSTIAVVRYGVDPTQGGPNGP